MEKVAVVTGSNKGIGFSIVKGLCQKFDGVVYLTSRDIAKGEAALRQLNDLGLKPLYHQLDTVDQESINKFRDDLKIRHGGIDLLINNAGVKFDAKKYNLSEQARETIKVNYYGTLHVSEALFPLLRQDAKVVNVSSAAGFLKKIASSELQARFADKSLTVPQLSELMENYIRAAEKGDVTGWNTPYSVSKVGMSALSIIHQKIFDDEIPNRNIKLNFVHPGYVMTDMTEQRGQWTSDEGARSTLFCALKAEIKGKYVWFDNEIVDWYGPGTPTPY